MPCSWRRCATLDTPRNGLSQRLRTKLLARPALAFDQYDSAAEKRDELAAFHGCPLQQATTPYHVAELSAVFCITAKLAADVREGSKAVLPALKCDFRFTPASGLKSDIAPCPKSAKSGRSVLIEELALAQKCGYSGSPALRKASRKARLRFSSEER